MGAYSYTNYILPMIISGALAMAFGIYGWRHRSRPGALPFAVMCFLYLLWVGGAVLELMAIDPSPKIFWFKFQEVWHLPLATALLCFALDYANLDRWLTRRVLALLAIPPAIVILLIFTNHVHHLMWLNLSVMEVVHPTRLGWNYVFVGYSFVLALACTAVFVWLFFKSPRQRLPVAFCILGQLSTRVAFLADSTESNPFEPMQALIIAGIFSLICYAVALFYFGMFDLVSIGRTTMIDQMREGMLVLDTQKVIIEMNHAAEKILGVVSRRAKGGPAAQIIPSYYNINELLDDEHTPTSGIFMKPGDTAQYYELRLNRLKNRRGFTLGSLVLFHDVTERFLAQDKLLEQQRALGALRERHRMARELHDDLGQVLGYVKLQAKTAQELLAQDKPREAHNLLVQLSAAVQESHTDVREYIMGADEAFATEDSFFPMLKHFLERFTENCGIGTELRVTADMREATLGPTAEVQLFRIIQEALTNVRKHAQARSVLIDLSLCDGHAQTIVRDDGPGFDPSLLETAEGRKFGVRFMQERAKEVGGSVQIRSAQNEGTEIIIRLPVQRETP